MWYYLLDNKKTLNKNNERVYFKKCFYTIQNRISKVVMKKKTPERTGGMMQKPSNFILRLK